MLRQVHPGPLCGSFRPPADKSISHRALLLSALACGESRISNLLQAADVDSTWTALTGLGLQIERAAGDVIVRGQGGRFISPKRPLYLGNSGTTMRLLSGLLAAQPGLMAVLVGDASLNKRPMRRVLQPLVQMGAMAFSSPSGTPPVLLLGRKLRAIRYRLPVASAQLKSALLLAALQAEGETMLIDPVPSRDHTERMLRQMGAIVERLGDEVRIWGQQPLRAIDYSVPGDFSSAAAFITAAMLSPGSSVLVQDVGLNSTRTGLLNVFRRMGAQIKVRKHASPDEKGEAWGEIKVTAAWRLSATEVLATEIPRLIDEVPLLVTAACQAKGTTVINGISELRVKESDRVESIVGPLRQLGAQIDVKGDQLVVRGQPGPFRGGLTVDAAHDHRIAMALAVAATVSDQPLQIAGAEWVDISYPNFFVHLERLQEAGKCAF